MDRVWAVRRGLADVVDLVMLCLKAGLAPEEAMSRARSVLREEYPELCRELARMAGEIETPETAGSLDRVRAWVVSQVGVQRTDAQLAYHRVGYTDDAWIEEWAAGFREIGERTGLRELLILGERLETVGVLGAMETLREFAREMREEQMRRAQRRLAQRRIAIWVVAGVILFLVCWMIVAGPGWVEWYRALSLR
jgi:hypothetical protein